jgi:superfamily II RNA helicase
MASTSPDRGAKAPKTFRGLKLFPFQRQAIAAILDGKAVMVAAPTGSGKTLVADYAIEHALQEKRRVVYTSPVKALSNQKFRDFREAYGEDVVGLMTGDVTIQPDALLLVMTTEIFRNTIFEAPERLAGFDFAVFDEVHYLDDRERGTVWEESLIYAPNHIRTVALSATVPNVHALAAWISEVRDRPVEVIIEEERPVPLTHKVWIPGHGPRNLDEVRRYLGTSKREAKRGQGGRGPQRDRARGGGGRQGGRQRGDRIRNRKVQARILREASHDLLDYLESRDDLPAIYFCFSRRECEERASDNTGRRLLNEEERRKMLTLFDDLAAKYEVTNADSTGRLRKLAARGVCFHHAGMLPIDKEIVERLFTTGLVKLLFATETFAVGVNMPARTVCFHALMKYDGIRFGPLMAREYWQMAGRAGRQGIDDKGHVYALLDETEMDYATLARLQGGEIEPVHSRFNLNYSAILNLYRRVGERVPEAWQRSFARYEREHTPKSKPPAGGRRGRMRRAGRNERGGGIGTQLIASRLNVLKRLHYLVDGKLSRKGTLCSVINGYELAVTEAYDGGWLFRCDPVDAAILFASMVYESRPADQASRPTRLLKGIRIPFAERMADVAECEAQEGIRFPTRGPDFGQAGPVERFAEGMDFEAVLDHTSLAPGDVVRLLRMTIQLLRQTAHALPRGDPCIPVLHEAKARIDRDVVDAKRQLELG